MQKYIESIPWGRVIRIGTVIVVLGGLAWMSMRLLGARKGDESASYGSRASEQKKSEAEKAATHTHREGIVELTEEAMWNVGLMTATAESRPLAQTITTTAVIKPNAYRTTQVSSRIPGRVVQAQANLGDAVRTGEILAILDSVELGLAKSEYLKARARLGVAQSTHDRLTRLFEAKIAAEKDVVAARGALVEAQAAFSGSQETLLLYGLSPAEIQAIPKEREAGPLSSTFPIRSPLTGTVVERSITVGQVVRADEKLYTIADLSTVWILVDIYEKDLSRISPGMEVAIHTDAYSDRTFRGRVAYISDLLDEATRTVRMRVEIENASRALRPGMFATATITLPPGKGANEAVTIPAAAVQTIGGKPVVFVQTGQRTFQRRSVTLGRSDGALTEVLSGVKPGEVVASAGSFYLKSEASRESIGGE